MKEKGTVRKILILGCSDLSTGDASRSSQSQYSPLLECGQGTRRDPAMSGQMDRCLQIHQGWKQATDSMPDGSILGTISTANRGIGFLRERGGGDW